jgi:hypothetical protein
VQKKKSPKKVSASAKPDDASQQLAELAVQFKKLQEDILAQQNALLIEIAKKANVPMEEPVIPPPPPKPITKDSLLLELANHILEAWTQHNTMQNSRQLAVFNKLNSPPLQKLMKDILDFKGQ